MRFSKPRVPADAYSHAEFKSGAARGMGWSHMGILAAHMGASTAATTPTDRGTSIRDLPSSFLMMIRRRGIRVFPLVILALSLRETVAQLE